jgi:hypothetical protein
MNIHDVRRRSRRSLDNRRVQDRRIVPYPFGSDEWIENIKQNYLAWPKEDRRKTTRRHAERRANDRRQQQLSEQLQSLQKYSSLVLTREELKMIEELYKSDLD